MKAQEAADLGDQIANIVVAGKPDKAYDLLKPVLAERTPFRLLDRIGIPVGLLDLSTSGSFLERIAAGKTQGGWVVIASALGQQLKYNLADSLSRCHDLVIAADIWYATDIFGERVSGPALVYNFHPGLKMLAPWRFDANRWVRRNIGVAVHLWSKRSQGAVEESKKVKALLEFLVPMFEEKNIDAVKGIGWGLKSLGKYYPDLLTLWLEEQIINRRRQARAVMVRKAVTYLSDRQRTRVTGVRQK